MLVKLFISSFSHLGLCKVLTHRCVLEMLVTIIVLGVEMTISFHAIQQRLIDEMHENFEM